MLTELQILCLVGIVFFYFIAIPLVLYHGRKYYQNRHHIIYTKRYSFITIYEIFFALSKLFIDGTGYMVLFITTFTSFDEWIYVAYFLVAINEFLFFGIIACINTRFILLCFDINFNKALSDNKWKSIINDKYSSNSDEIKWYLQNKWKYGNIK